MLIEVTQEDIDSPEGEMRCKTCPVALALNRATGRSWTVSTDWATCGSSSILNLPDAASDFITNYDSNQPVKPFTFELDYEPTR